MTQNTRMLNRFEYHIEDIDCSDCLFNNMKSKYRKRDCRGGACRFEGIRQEAIKNNRIKRNRGWFKWET